MTPSLSKASRSELKALLTLGSPLAAAQISQMIMASATAAVLGHLGGTEFAGGSLGVAIASALVIVTQGILAGLQPLVARGRSPHERGRILVGALCLALVAAVPVTLALLHVSTALELARIAPAIAREADRYCAAYAIGVPFALCVGTLRYFLVAIERTWVVMVIAICSALWNSALCWMLAYGKCGMPALGVRGAGLAASMTWIVMFAGLAIYGANRRLYPVSRESFARGNWAASAREVFGLGWPIAVSYASEIWLFMLFSMTAAGFGAEALSVSQLTVTIVNTVFMVPLALSQAAMIRVAHHAGNGRVVEVTRAAKVALTLGAGYAAICGLLLVSFPEGVLHIFVSADDPADEQMKVLAREMFRLAALYVLCDALQSIAAGALRGMKQTRAPMLIVVCGYWGFGFPVGWLLSHATQAGASGIWLALGITALGVAVLMIRLWSRRQNFVEMGTPQRVQV